MLWNQINCISIIGMYCKKKKKKNLGIVLFYFNTGAKTIADVLYSWHNFMIPHIKEGIKKGFLQNR